MSFFNKIFKKKVEILPEVNDFLNPQDEVSIDQKFVKKFIHKGGKFLYCADLNEIGRAHV